MAKKGKNTQRTAGSIKGAGNEWKAAYWRISNTLASSDAVILNDTEMIIDNSQGSFGFLGLIGNALSRAYFKIFVKRAGFNLTRANVDIKLTDPEPNQILGITEIDGVNNIYTIENIANTGGGGSGGNIAGSGTARYATYWSAANTIASSAAVELSAGEMIIDNAKGGFGFLKTIGASLSKAYFSVFVSKNNSTLLNSKVDMHLTDATQNQFLAITNIDTVNNVYTVSNVSGVDGYGQAGKIACWSDIDTLTYSDTAAFTSTEIIINTAKGNFGFLKELGSGASATNSKAYLSIAASKTGASTLNSAFNINFTNAAPYQILSITGINNDEYTIENVSSIKPANIDIKEAPGVDSAGITVYSKFTGSTELPFLKISGKDINTAKNGTIELYNAAGATIYRIETGRPEIFSNCYLYSTKEIHTTSNLIADGSITGGSVTCTGSLSSGALTVTGNIGVSGNINLTGDLLGGDISTGDINVSGNIKLTSSGYIRCPYPSTIGFEYDSVNSYLTKLRVWRNVNNADTTVRILLDNPTPGQVLTVFSVGTTDLTITNENPSIVYKANTAPLICLEKSINMQSMEVDWTGFDIESENVMAAQYNKVTGKIELKKIDLDAWLDTKLLALEEAIDTKISKAIARMENKYYD